MKRGNCWLLGSLAQRVALRHVERDSDDSPNGWREATAKISGCTKKKKERSEAKVPNVQMYITVVSGNANQLLLCKCSQKRVLGKGRGKGQEAGGGEGGKGGDDLFLFSSAGGLVSREMKFCCSLLGPLIIVPDIIELACRHSES